MLIGSQPTNNSLHCNETHKFIPVFTRPRHGRPTVVHDFGARFAPNRWLKAPLLYGGFALRNATAQYTEIPERPQQVMWLKTEVFIHTATHTVFIPSLH